MNPQSQQGAPLALSSRHAALGVFYVSQTLPMAFLVTALPVLLRQSGLSLTAVTLTQLLALPWALKFLWAPLVDRTSPLGLGHRKGWMVMMLGGTLCALALMGLAQGTPCFFLAALLLACCCATQDIAVDGWAVETLKKTERPTANALQTGAVHLSKLIGGGLLLACFPLLGVSGVLGFLALVFVLTLCVALGIREGQTREKRPSALPNTRALWESLRRPGMPAWLGCVFVFRMGSVTFLTLLRPYLVDAGWTLEEIARALGVYLALGALGASLVAPLLMHRLGERRTLLLSGVLAVLGALVFVLLVFLGQGGAILALPMVCFGLFEAICVVVLFTAFMHKSRPEAAGTDFTLQQCTYALTLQVGTASGYLAAQAGYLPVFAGATVVFALAVVPLALRLEWQASGGNGAQEGT